MLKIFIIIMYAILFISCESMKQDQYIESFASFVSEIEKNYTTYKQEDWDKAYEKYEFYTTIEYEKHKDKLAEAQKSEINKLIGRYNGIKIKATVITAKAKIKNIIEQVGSTNEITKDSTIIQQ